MVNWLFRFFKGMLVGIGAILPGLSGGVLAVIFGIYDPLIRFLANLKKDFLKNVLFFLPVVLGAGVGVLLFSAVVTDAFEEKFKAQFICLFIGFVLGTLPSLFKKAGAMGRKPVHYGIMVVTAVLLLLVLLAGQALLTNITPSLPVWIGAGAIFALGFIVPGLSPSNFLIYLGLYSKMTSGISNLDFGVIIPLLIGAAVCVLLLAKLINLLFDRHYAGMYHFILGTVIGSSLAIFPAEVFPAFSEEGLAAMGLSFGSAVLFCVALLIVGIIVSWLFSKLEDKVERQQEDAAATE